MNNDQPIINPYLGLLIAILSVSTSAILVKLATAPAPVIATYRLLFTILLMTPFVWTKTRHEWSLIRARDWVFCTLSGIFLAFHFILWFESLNYTSVASSVVLVSLQPLFAFIGAYLFFKERLNWKAVLGGIIAIVGSMIISWGDFKISGLALFGDILALLGALMATGYLLFGQNVRKRLSLIAYTYIVYGIATLTLLIYDIALNYPLLPYPGKDWLLFLLMALFPTLLGHSIFNWAIKWISVSVISMGTLGEPVGASILAYFILGEKLQFTQLIGGIVILLGIAVFLKGREKQIDKMIQSRNKKVDARKIP
jgi:drug/metabolite transporter (DMT)-like permease